MRPLCQDRKERGEESKCSREPHRPHEGVTDPETILGQPVWWEVGDQCPGRGLSREGFSSTGAMGEGRFPQGGPGPMHAPKGMEGQQLQAQDLQGCTESPFLFCALS